MIHVESLTKSFTDIETNILLFSDLNFSVSAGETVALMGQSGSGKSTLLHLLGGFLNPDSGHINIDGQNITGMSDQQLSSFRRRYIGTVFQGFNLIPSLKAGDNIRFVRKLNGLPPEDEFTKQLFKRLGLESRLSHYPSQLSGGEQQRVAIARALAHQPKVIFADEPTGNLDEITAGQVMEQMMDAVSIQRSTLLLVTHSNVTANYLNACWRLEKGQLFC